MSFEEQSDALIAQVDMVLKRCAEELTKTLREML